MRAEVVERIEEDAGLGMGRGGADLVFLTEDLLDGRVHCCNIPEKAKSEKQQKGRGGAFGALQHGIAACVMRDLQWVSGRRLENR